MHIFYEISKTFRVVNVINTVHLKNRDFTQIVSIKTTYKQKILEMHIIDAAKKCGAPTTIQWIPYVFRCNSKGILDTKSKHLLFFVDESYSLPFWKR